jgi:competence protein ComEC
MIPLLAPLLALIAGILASAHLDPRSVWLCLPLAVLLAFARKWYALLAVFLLGAGLRSLEPPVPLDPPAEAARVEGRLLRQPEWRGLGVYLDLQVLRVDGRPYRGRARLTEFLDDPELLALFRAHELGTSDRVEVLVRLHRPATYRNPGVFNFRRYLERQGIYWTGTIRNPRLITVLDRGWSGWRRLDRIEEWIGGRVARQFAEDRAAQGLVLGMVLGRKHELPAPVEHQFQAGGLYHLVVVSGFNLAVVAAAAALMARVAGVGRSQRLVVVIFAVLGYATLVGGQTPVLRATLMVLILVAGKALDRDYSPANAIALAAFMLLLWDPTSLEDTSFQMTFAAVTAVSCVGMPASRWLLENVRSRLNDFGNAELDGWLPPETADWRLARRMWCELHGLPHAVVTVPWRLALLVMEALIISLAVEFVLAWFMVESFHRVSPISPLLNIPAGLAAALITPVGLLLIVLPDFFAGPAAWVVQNLVRLLMGVLDFSLSLPYASLRVPSAPVWLWAIYAGAAGVTLAGILRRLPRLCLPGFAILAATQTLVIFADFPPAPPPEVTVTFLDVGQGDSTLVEFPDGRRMLIDGGGVAAGRFLGLQDQSTFSIGENVVSSHLFSRGIRRLDAVVLTHAHHDHMDGLTDVLANFRVKELWVGRNPAIPAFRQLLDQAQQRGVALRLVAAGYRQEELTVLHPPPHWQTKKIASNNDSVVLLLQYGAQTALFSGDLELIIPLPSFVSLLKVPHHGSRGVRMRVRSEVRVISVGANNPFGHPHPSSLPALRTDTLGAIQVIMEGNHPRVRLIGVEKLPITN